MNVSAGGGVQVGNWVLFGSFATSVGVADEIAVAVGKIGVFEGMSVKVGDDVCVGASVGEGVVVNVRVAVGGLVGVRLATGFAVGTIVTLRSKLAGKVAVACKTASNDDAPDD